MGGQNQCVVGAEVKEGTDERDEDWIGGEESDVRDLHHLVIGRRDGGSVTAIYDVSEPVAVVLDKRAVAIGERPLGRDHTNRDRNLRRCEHESGEEALEGGALHVVSIRSEEEIRNPFGLQDLSTMAGGLQFQIAFVCCIGRGLLVRANLDGAILYLFVELLGKTSGLTAVPARCDSA